MSAAASQESGEGAPQREQLGRANAQREQLGRARATDDSAKARHGLPLELRRAREGLCHYLEGAPLSAGATIEVWVAGEWRAARYEWSDDLPTGPELFGLHASPTSVVPSMRFRWPSSTLH